MHNDLFQYLSARICYNAISRNRLKEGNVMTLYDIRVEHRIEPYGLSVKIPRFSWKIASVEHDVVQTAYQITITAGNAAVWDSGRVTSEQSVLIPYDGAALEDETRYDVRVTVWDNHGNSARGDTFFQTGLMDAARLQADLITHNFPSDETACPVFYTTFAVQKPVAKACVYATAHGVYEMSLNGKRIGDAYMAPGWTSYHKRLQYQCYDLTASLREANIIEMTVGNGWYKGILSYDLKPNRYGDRVAALAEIHIDYTDGSRQIIATNERWRVRTDEIRYSEIYMGERIDTNAPEHREGKTVAVPFDKRVLTAQESAPVRVTERIAPTRVFTDPKGNHIVDFGQNITGLVEITIQGTKGQTVTVRHAETLDQYGVFYPDTLRAAESRDTYILSGEQQTLMPHFTFHGFRYIAVDGISNMQADMFTACVMHTDMRQTGAFWCDNEKINRLQSNIAWSMRDNFFDIPTDCPQRDERLGWTGDAQVFSWTAAYLRDTALFFSKWMRDMAAESSQETGVPHIVPDIQGSRSSAAWSDAAAIIPWVVYQTYGDIRILEESWRCMHEWADYIIARTDRNGLWTSDYQFGDWLALDREEGPSSVGATDVYFVANAYFVYVTDIVAQAALALGKPKEAAYYKNVHDKTLQSFREEYFTARGRIVSETQTACVLALHFGLAREQDREAILKTLVANIERHKNHLTTGFVGTPYLCHALSDNGRHDKAATLLMKEDLPSWLYAVNMGATTIWEKWNAVLPDGSMQHPGLNSMNHYANGAIGDWLYRKVGGVSPTEPGYRAFRVTPMLVPGIKEARAELETPYGKIVSHWRCKGGQMTVHITVPPNTRACVRLPEKDEEFALGSGAYTYAYKTTTCLKRMRYTPDSTVADILATPVGAQMLSQYAPQLMEHAAVEYVQKMTLTEIAAAEPAFQGLCDAILAALNRQEETAQ